MLCLYQLEDFPWFKRFTSEKGTYDSQLARRFKEQLNLLSENKSDSLFFQPTNTILSLEDISGEFGAIICSVDQNFELDCKRENLLALLKNAYFYYVADYNNNQSIILADYTKDAITSFTVYKNNVIYLNEKNHCIYLYTDEDKEFVDSVLAPLRESASEK